MNKLIWWGLTVAAVVVLECLDVSKDEEPEKSDKEPMVAKRLIKSLKGPGKYNGASRWRRVEGFE